MMDDFSRRIKGLERRVVRSDAHAANLCRKMRGITVSHERDIKQVLKEYDGITLCKRHFPFSLYNPELRYESLVGYNTSRRLFVDLADYRRKPLENLIAGYFGERDGLIREEYVPARKVQKRCYNELLSCSSIMAFQPELRAMDTLVYMSDPDEKFITRFLVSPKGFVRAMATDIPNVGRPSYEEFMKMNKETRKHDVFYVSNPSRYITGKLLFRYSYASILKNHQPQQDLMFVSFCRGSLGDN